MVLADDLRCQMRCHLIGLASKGWRIQKLHFGYRLADIICGCITALGIACQNFGLHLIKNRITRSHWPIGGSIANCLQMRHDKIQPIKTMFLNELKRIIKRHRIGNSRAAGD